MAMHVLGPLHDQTKNMFILKYLYLASRCPEAILLRETSAMTVAETLMKIFTHLRIPFEILMERAELHVNLPR